MLSKLTKVLGPRVGMLKLSLMKNSPELYLAGGIGMGVAAAVMLAKAHKKSEEEFEQTLQEIDNVHLTAIDGDISKEEERQLLMPHYAELGKRAIVLYGPAVLMGTSSLLLLLASHSTLRRRNQGLVAVATLLERSFTEYRKRVREEVGEETENRLYSGGESRSFTEMSVVDGKKKKTKGEQTHIPEQHSPIMYQRIFDDACRNWRPDRSSNLAFLTMQQSFMNDKLDWRGWILLNEVYEELGFEPTSAGAVVGWSKKRSDQPVLFGIDDPINSYEEENRFVLNFNVDGAMFEDIDEV